MSFISIFFLLSFSILKQSGFVVFELIRNFNSLSLIWNFLVVRYSYKYCLLFNTASIYAPSEIDSFQLFYFLALANHPITISYTSQPYSFTSFFFSVCLKSECWCNNNLFDKRIKF